MEYKSKFKTKVQSESTEVICLMIKIVDAHFVGLLDGMCEACIASANMLECFC